MSGHQKKTLRTSDRGPINKKGVIPQKGPRAPVKAKKAPVKKKAK